MAYTHDQIKETVDYVAQAVLDPSVTAEVSNEFKDFLALVLKSMTIDLPSKNRPKQIEISKDAFRSQDNPLNAFFKYCEASEFSLPPLFCVVMQRSGESIDRTAGDSFVVHQNNPNFEEEDSFVDPYLFSKAAGKRKHDIVKSIEKPKVEPRIHTEQLESAPISLKRKDEIEKYFNAQQRRAEESQSVDRRSKEKPRHKYIPQTFSPAFSQYKQTNPCDVLNLTVAFTQLQMLRRPGPGYRK